MISPLSPPQQPSKGVYSNGPSPQLLCENMSFPASTIALPIAMEERLDKVPTLHQVVKASKVNKIASTSPLSKPCVEGDSSSSDSSSSDSLYSSASARLRTAADATATGVVVVSDVEQKGVSRFKNAAARARQRPPTGRDGDDSSVNAATILNGVKYTYFSLLLAVSVFVSYRIASDWVKTGQHPSSAFSMESVDAIGMPSAGMIPAPYATDNRCFYPTPVKCTAYFGEMFPELRRTFDCMSWVTSVNMSHRGASTSNDVMTVWTIDGQRGSDSGFYFTSILDFVEYTFAFPNNCTEPYLWVFVSGNNNMVGQARDPQESMKAFAQTSFLIQGGQYVMVAFSIQQDVDLSGNVANTTSLSASSMQVSDFNANLSHQATAVFRPGSFKIATLTQMPGQTVWEMMANIGGWVGLFLGVSFFQIIDGVQALRKQLTRRQQKQMLTVVERLKVAGSKGAAARDGANAGTSGKTKDATLLDGRSKSSKENDDDDDCAL